MKRLLIPLFAIFLLSSCTNDETSPFENIESQVFSMENAYSQSGVLENISIKLHDIKASNEVKRVKYSVNSKTGDCPTTVFVPDDYATIQEAVIAVCDYGNVFVRTGVYNETVGIDSPGLFIVAIGDVLLNGGFGIADYVGEITIQHFNIDMTNSIYAVAFGGYFNYECNIKNNNIFGDSHIGIYFSGCNNMTIDKNKILAGDKDIDYGILIDQYPLNPSYPISSNNRVTNNTTIGMNGLWLLKVQGNMSLGSGIEFRGKSYNNVIQGNEVYSCLRGISLWEYGENSIVKNNTSNDNELWGIRVDAMNNTIGPNNEANNNGLGIYLDITSSNNHTFNNTSLNNTDYDLKDEGTDNSFKNNTAETTFGF